MDLIPNRELVKLLKSKFAKTNFINRLKIGYRPIICPFNLILHYIPPDTAVFDIGCGSGQMALLAANFSNIRSFYGIEIDKNLIQNANQLLRDYNTVKIKFDVYDGFNLPEGINEADIILMIDVLHHIPVKNQLAFLDNIYRSMKSNSRLILKDINKDHPFVFFNKLHDLIFSREIGNEMGLGSVLHHLTEIGFKIKVKQKIVQYVYPHYLIIAEK